MSANEKLWDLIEDNPTCMMISDDAETGMHARPMRAIPDRDAKEIWFYTRLSSGKSADIAIDGEVCLAFADPGASEYVSVTGDAAISRDRMKCQMPVKLPMQPTSTLG